MISNSMQSSTVMLFSVLMVQFVLVKITFSHHDESPPLAMRKFTESGNLTLSGVFPVHVGGCNLRNFRCKYVVLSQAMVYAVQQINADPSILPNVTLGFEIYDSCLVERLAMEIAMEIINRKKLSTMYSEQNVCVSDKYGLGEIPIMVGTGSSGGSILVSNLLQVENIPLISYAATSDELSRKKTYPTFLRTVPPDRYQSQAMADLAEHFKWTYIAAIAIDNAYGRSGIDYLKKSLASKQLCLSMERYFNVDLQNMNQTRYTIRRIIQDLKSMTNVKVVVLYSTASDAFHIFDEAERHKVFGKTWIASEGWGDDRRLTRHINIVKGLLGIVYHSVEVQEFKKYLMELNSSYKPVKWWDTFWNICTENQSKITPEVYSKTLYTQMSASAINAVYAIAYALDSMYQCKVPHGLLEGGKCPTITPSVDPNDLLTYLKAVDFESPVSRVTFDSNGDTAGSYTIINLQKRNDSWEFSPVGAWEASSSPQLDIDDEKIMWNGDSKGQVPQSVCQEMCKPGYWQTQQVGCCWQCIACDLDEISQKFNSSKCTKCPEDYIPNHNHTVCVKVPLFHISYSHPFGYSFILFSCIGILATICACAVFARYNKTPVVKASNRELSYVLLFCIAMCYFAPFIYLAKPTNIGCILVQVWFYIFYTTCIAILAAKTNKIVILFEERLPKSKINSGYFKYRHIILVISAIVFELVVIVIWVAVDPPVPYINKSTRYEFIQTCKPSRELTGKICNYFLMSVLILASLFCCYFAYKARKLPDNFNEGKFIAFSLYILIISWLTFYPVFLNIQDLYTVVVLCVTTVIAASGILVCMFLPKIYIILVRPEKNTKRYIQEQLSRHAFRLGTMEATTAAARDQSLPGLTHPDTRL